MDVFETLLRRFMKKTVLKSTESQMDLKSKPFTIVIGSWREPVPHNKNHFLRRRLH